MTLSGTALCQNYTLPSVLFDSMFMEVSRGRSCDSVRVAQTDEIKKIGKELIDTNRALDLKIRESSTLSNLVDNAKESNQILTQQFALDLSKEKRKTKRWRKVSIVEAVGLIGLLILML